jgi:carbon-monoxide dehydrogenase medium subunit
MMPFSYARPTTVDEAVALLDEYGPEAKLLAGGTDLLVELRGRRVQPRVIIDVKRVVEMTPGIEEIDGALRISATAVMADLIGDERVRRHFPALVEGAAVVGSVQIRNRATLAGNVCNASPAADTAPALLVYGAKVSLMSPSGTRRLALDDFLVGPGETVLEAGEMVIAITLPLPSRPVGAAFGRVTRRRGVDLATINLCCLVDSDGTTTFAYGAVGPRPFLVRDQSGVLADRGADERDRAATLREMTNHASPITNVRASAEYRQAMLDVMSRRVLERAIDRLAAA